MLPHLQLDFSSTESLYFSNANCLTQINLSDINDFLPSSLQQKLLTRKQYFISKRSEQSIKNTIPIERTFPVFNEKFDIKTFIKKDNLVVSIRE